MTNGISRVGQGLAWLALGIAAISLASARGEEIDLTAWREIPVFHHGRTMPMDTFSRLAVEIICETNKGKLVTKGKVELGLKGYYTEKELADSRYQAALQLFPKGDARWWTAEELLLSWVVEPENWEDVPFISAHHEEVRKLLGVPVQSEEGGHLRFVSPRQVDQSAKLKQFLSDENDRRMGRDTANYSDTVRSELKRLIEGYTLFRRITFDPRDPLTLGPVPTRGDSHHFMGQLGNAYRLVNTREEEERSLLKVLLELRDANLFPREAAGSLSNLVEKLEELADIYRNLSSAAEAQARNGGAAKPLSVPRAEINAAIVQVREATLDFSRVLEELKEEVFGTHAKKEEVERGGRLVREAAAKSKDLVRIAREMHLALYDNDDSLALVPALNPAALSRSRDVKQQSHPWISLATVLHGSDEVLGLTTPKTGYPKAGIEAVRSSFQKVAEVYRQRESADRATVLPAALEEFAKSLRVLGDELTVQREGLVRKELTKEQYDADILAHTKYPAAGATRPEVTYNQVDPFKWSWIISLGAFFCFCLAFGNIRAYAYWIGMVVLVLGIAWTAYGFYLRVMVTNWAPVTNMYETVIFVPMVLSVLGLWFLVLPATATGMNNGWRLTAIPGSFEATELTDDQVAIMPESAWNIAGFGITILRLALVATLFYFLAIVQYGDGNRAYFLLLPDLSQQVSFDGIAQKIMVWVVSSSVFLVTLYLIPRLIPAIVASLFFIPRSWTQDGERTEKWIEQIYARWPFALGTSAGAFGLFWIAWWAPVDVLNENFSPLQPVLRSNFWLTIHVLTIVASYGAGALALVIGNIALLYYIFGAYRAPEVAARPLKGFAPAKQASNPEELLLPMQPPAESAALSDYAYRAVQVAVVLLATGTILGGLWADVSWGRFWGWDPKEVWALISLLIYLAVLHGRFAGWFDNFAMITGTIVGATAIGLSWYGVNYLLPMIAGGQSVGLHSYGGDIRGGQIWFASGVVVQWIVWGIAAARYGAETSQRVQPRQVEFPVAADVVDGEPSRAAT